jgi:hypothetical protein
MIYQSVYLSQARHDFDADELLALLVSARAENLKRDITGLLLYHDRVFIQLLEGDKRDVEEVLARVRRDPRHSGMIVLLAELSPFGRIFPEWKMGFLHMRYLDRGGIAGLESNDMNTVQGALRAQPEVLAARLLLSIIACNRFALPGAAADRRAG